MGWMAWTLPTALFFGTIGLLLAGMTVWELRSPSLPRRGFLPFPTTRGDRLFVGLLGSALLNLACLAVPHLSAYVGLALGLGWMLVVALWG